MRQQQRQFDVGTTQRGFEFNQQLNQALRDRELERERLAQQQGQFDVGTTQRGFEFSQQLNQALRDRELERERLAQQDKQFGLSFQQGQDQIAFDKDRDMLNMALALSAARRSDPLAMINQARLDLPALLEGNVTGENIEELLQQNKIGDTIDQQVAEALLGAPSDVIDKFVQNLMGTVNKGMQMTDAAKRSQWRSFVQNLLGLEDDDDPSPFD